MKLVIFGSRRIATYYRQPKDEQRKFTTKEIENIFAYLDNFRKTAHETVDEVVCGMAKEGGDYIGKVWAEWEGISVTPFPALWRKYGKGAGHIRNKEMAAYADFGIGIWDGLSTGTRNMFKELRAHEKPYLILPVGEKLTSALGFGIGFPMGETWTTSNT